MLIHTESSQLPPTSVVIALSASRMAQHGDAEFLLPHIRIVDCFGLFFFLGRRLRARNVCICCYPRSVVVYLCMCV